MPKKRPLPQKIIARQERRIRAQLDAETLAAAAKIEGNKRRAAAAEEKKDR